MTEEIEQHSSHTDVTRAAEISHTCDSLMNMQMLFKCISLSICMYFICICIMYLYLYVLHSCDKSCTDIARERILAT